MELNGWVFGIGMVSQYRIQAVPGYIAYSLSQHMHVCENHNKALSCIRPTLERRPPLKWVDSEYSGTCKEATIVWSIQMDGTEWMQNLYD